MLAQAKDADGALLIDEGERANILALASRPKITAADFEREAPGLLGKLNTALDSKAGQAMINSLDAKNDEKLDGYRRQIEEAAKRNPAGPGAFDPGHPDYPQAMAMAVQWGNRTGGVDKISTWAAGETVDLCTDTAKPEKAKSTGAPGMDGLTDYFSKTKYFRDISPDELRTWTERHRQLAEAGRLAQDQKGESPEPGRATKQEGQPRPSDETPPVARDAAQAPEGGAQGRDSVFSSPKSSTRANNNGTYSAPSSIVQQNSRTAPGPTGQRASLESPMPRPINVLTDPLPPEDAPDGLDREAWERRQRGLPSYAAHAGGQALSASLPRASAAYAPPKYDRPPGYVAAFPEPDEGGGAFFPERRAGSGASTGLPGASEEMSTLDFVKETFRLAAEGVPETPRPKRPAWFKPSNPEELTTEEYVWEIFNPQAARRSRL